MIFAQLIVQIVIVVILIAFLVILYKYFSEKNTPYNISRRISMCYKDKKFVMVCFLIKSKLIYLTLVTMNKNPIIAKSVVILWDQSKPLRLTIL